MSNRIETYIHQSLASAGFAVLDPHIAATLRPDLWGSGNGGMEAAWEFSRAKNMLNGLAGLSRFAARIEGTAQDIAVVARSSDYLAMRIEWVIGRSVIDLFELSESKPVAAPAPIKARAESVSIDRYQGVTTAEPGRTCSSCDNLTAGHACRKAKDTGMNHPPANTPHRCMSYVPLWNSNDARKGPQLWPEILTAEV